LQKESVAASIHDMRLPNIPSYPCDFPLLSRRARFPDSGCCERLSLFFVLPTNKEIRLPRRFRLVACHPLLLLLTLRFYSVLTGSSAIGTMSCNSLQAMIRLAMTVCMIA